MQVIQTHQHFHVKWCIQQREPEFTPCAPDPQHRTPREDVKKTQNKTHLFFSYVAIEKAVQTICSDWTRDKAGRDVCTASGLFGKPGLHLLCVPSPFYHPILRSFPAVLVCPGSAAPQIQGCTYGSNQPFREKKAQKEKKNTFLSLWPPIRPHWSYILLRRHRAVASLSLNIPKK